MASVALFVALGGASYAAVSLPKDSVGTRQLREDAVTHSKLANGSVDTGQLRDRSVEASKLAVKTDGDVSVEASGKVKVKGSSVGLN